MTTITETYEAMFTEDEQRRLFEAWAEELRRSLSMSKTLWMIEHETIGDAYVSGEIGRPEAEARLKRLGLAADEVADQLDALDEDKELGKFLRDNDGERA